MVIWIAVWITLLMFEFRIRKFCQQFCFAQRLTNKFLSQSTPVQSRNELITESSTSWAENWNACKQRKKNDFVFFESWHRQKALTANLFVYPRRVRKEKANSYFTFLSFWYALKISRDSWLSSLTALVVGRLSLLFVWYSDHKHLSVPCFTTKLHEFPNFPILVFAKNV